MPEGLVQDVLTYMRDHDITKEQLLDLINANEDVVELKDFETAPYNVWYTPPESFQETFIKLKKPEKYLFDFLDGNIAENIM